MLESFTAAFKDSEDERDSWDFAERKICKRPCFIYIDPPEGSKGGVKKVWEKRRYGLWPAPAITDLKDKAEMIPVQRDLYKSHIAQLLISRDAENFAKLGNKNHFKDAYSTIYAENTRRLAERMQIVLNDLSERVGEDKANDLFLQIDDLIKNGAEKFVLSCLRPYGNQDENFVRELIHHQVEVLVVKLKEINGALSTRSGIMGLESLAASNSPKTA